MSTLRHLYLFLAFAICCHGGQMIVTMKSGERLIGEVSEKSDDAVLILNSVLLGERFFFQNTLAGRVDEIKGINHELQELVGVGIRLQPFET